MDLKEDINARLAEKMFTDDETRNNAIAFYEILAAQGNPEAIAELKDLANDDDGRYDGEI